MITIIPDTPKHVAAFQATGSVSKEDFEQVVFPHVEAKVNVFDELNYLLLLNTDVDNFTFGAWVQDVMLGLKNLTKWNRIAIVTDQKGVQNFTEIVSVLMPGEVKSYPVEFLAQAILWCAQGNEQED